MNKRAILELTPLLDIILIMLFAVIINFYQGSVDLKKDNIDITEKFIKEEIKADKEKEKNERIEKSIKDILNLNEDKYMELIGNIYGDINTDDLNKGDVSNQLINEMIKYSEISKQIKFIDIGLSGENNRIFLNNNKTNSYILYEEIDIIENRNKKKKDIKDIIRKEINNKKNKDILMITITIKDSDVYKYAYDLLKDAIDEVINEYGEDKVLKGEFLLN